MKTINRQALAKIGMAAADCKNKALALFDDEVFNGVYVDDIFIDTANENITNIISTLEELSASLTKLLNSGDNSSSR